MPVLKKKDSKGSYYQYGDSGKKYYVDELGEEKAKEKADKQGIAIRLSGYSENNSCDENYLSSYDEEISEMIYQKYIEENVEISKYEDIDFTIPSGVKERAKYGLELRSKYGRGGTSVGMATARYLVNNDKASPAKVKHISKYFPRHAGDNLSDTDKDGDPPSNGYIAWLLWGDDEGRAWSEKIVAQMERYDEAESNILKYQKDGFLIELNKVNLDDVSGRLKLKMSAHEIYKDEMLYNKNGITWTERNTVNNIKSAIGMPYVVRFFDSDNEIPFDHGTETYDEYGNVSFPDSVQVGSVQNAYVEEVNGKKLLMTEGYISTQRYPNFVKWLREVIQNEGEKIYGSVEINGKGNSKSIVYENGRTNSDGSIKFGRKPKTYDYTALAILYGEEPADDMSQIFELNSKDKRRKNMDFKELYEKEVEAKKALELEVNALKKEKDELNKSLEEKSEAVVNAHKELKAKETEIEKEKTEHAEVNSKYEDLLKEKQLTEVNSYFEGIKALFEESELNELKVFVESVDLAGLKNKESEICTAKYKESKKSEPNTKDDKQDTENNSVTVVTDGVEPENFGSFFDIQ